MLSDLGSFLKDKRESKKLSIRELARMTDVSHSYISQLENNKRNKPRPYVLRVLSEALDIPYIELMKKAGYPSVETDSLFDAFGLTPSEIEETKETGVISKGKEIRIDKVYLDNILRDDEITVYYEDKIISKDEKENIDQLIKIHLKGR